MLLAFLFYRRSTTFQAKKLTIAKGAADHRGHMTPDAVKLVEKGIAGNDSVSELRKRKQPTKFISKIK